MTEKEWRKEFRKNLRVQLILHDMTQRELADRMGVSEADISRYVSGTRTPRVYSVMMIAKAIGCSIDDLILPNLPKG